MPQHEMPTHYGPEEIGLRQPGDVELEDIENRIFYADHTHDEALRGYFERQLGTTAFLRSEKLAMKTDTSYDPDEFRD